MSEKMEKAFKKRTDKPIEGRRYAVISSQSIVTLAESCGILKLNEEIASKLGEDVTYRLREIIQGCSVHMRNSNERILRSTVVARVLPNCSEMKVYGYLSGGTSEFLYVPEANIFVSEYNELIVNLPQIAMEKQTFIEKGGEIIRGTFCSPDPVQCTQVEAEASTSTSEAGSSGSTSAVPSHLVEYYSTFAKVILCKHGEVLNCVLKDLRINRKIILVVPYFLNLFIEGLQALPRGSDACEHLLLMLHSLTLNRYIYREAAVVVNGLLTSLLTYAVDPMPFKLVSVSRDIELRGLASEAVTKVLVHWYGCEDSMLDTVLRKMQIILLDPNCTVRSHIGALSVLCSLGVTALNNSFWPHIEKFFDFLNKLPANSETLEIEGCLLKAAEFLYPQVFESTEDTDERLMWKLTLSDRMLRSYFGDRLCARWQYPLRGTSVFDCHSGKSNRDSGSNDPKSELEQCLNKKGYLGRFYSTRKKSLWSKPLCSQVSSVSQKSQNLCPESFQLNPSSTEIQVSKPEENVAEESKVEQENTLKEEKNVSIEENNKEEKRKALERKLENWKPGEMRNSGGSLSELFELPLMKHRMLSISSNKNFHAWTKELKQRKFNTHQIFSSSLYYKKSLQLNQKGKFINVHMSTWSRNFTDVFSTFL